MDTGGACVILLVILLLGRGRAGAAADVPQQAAEAGVDTAPEAQPDAGAR
ncbi:hypothetical protein [Streptomyces tsukubensis]|nr:hypothetical protein [Streptomyces tsukubensis]